MTTEVELLPMPKGEATGMYQAWSYDQMQAYARANIAHAVAPLQAEIERLNRILGRIVEGDGDTTVTIRTGADAFAAAREYLLRDQESAVPSAGQTTGITATELGYALKRATPAQVIEYLEDDVDMHVALSIYFEEQHNQRPAAVDEAMVERACRHWYVQWDKADRATKMMWAEMMYDLLAAALATQHQEPTT